MGALRIEIQNQILYVTLDSVKTGNAFSYSAAMQLREVLNSFGAGSRRAGAPIDSDLKGLIFRSSGRIFCSGGQLADYAAMKTATEGKKKNREIANTLQLLWNLQLPTVAIVQGDCFGGGVELLSCFDHVISAPHVQFGLWQRRIGLSFGWGGFHRLKAKVEIRALHDWSLTARSFLALEAKRSGLVNTICLPHQSQACAQNYLDAQSAMSRESANGLNRLFHAEAASEDARVDSSPETEVFEKLWWSKAHKAALKKFSGK